MPTISVENYLKAIYHLQGEEEARVKTKALANHLELSLPSATNMMKSLAEDGLVDYRPYHGALLTERGKRLALRVIRHHRLVELFLVRTLGFTWDEVHDEAELLEHAISDTLASRIDAFLDYPRFDPHGDPIPTADGEVFRRSTGTLSARAVGEAFRVTRVLDQSPAVLQYLESIGLTPGARVRIDEIHPFDGPFALNVNGNPTTIGRSLASRVLVEIEPSPDGPTGAA